MTNRYRVNGRQTFDTLQQASAHAERIFQRTGNIVEIRAIRSRGAAATRAFHNQIAANPPQGTDAAEWRRAWQQP